MSLLGDLVGVFLFFSLKLCVWYNLGVSGPVCSLFLETLSRSFVSDDGGGGGGGGDGS